MSWVCFYLKNLPRSKEMGHLDPMNSLLCTVRMGRADTNVSARPFRVTNVCFYELDLFCVVSVTDNLTGQPPQRFPATSVALLLSVVLRWREG